MKNVPPFMARTCARLGARLRAARGAMAAACHDRDGLREELWDEQDLLHASKEEERRLRAKVEQRGAEVRAAQERGRVLQEELVDARNEVEELRAAREKQRTREKVLLWQLGATTAEVEELRAEVARLKAEAAGVGGLPSGQHPGPNGGR